MKLKKQLKYKNVLVASVFLMVISTSNATSIQILNPGFEYGFVGWDDTDPSAISLSASNTGNKSAKVTGKGGGFQQKVGVRQNTDYELVAYIRGDGEIGVIVNGTTYSDDGGGDDYFDDVDVSFNSGSATEVIIFGRYDGEKSRFDDFTLKSD